MTLPCRASWALQSAGSGAALFITLVHWTALHPYVVEYHLMQGAWANFLNVFLHLLNTLSFLLDIFITARPVRPHHFYWPALFGVWYCIFNVSYWAAGGTGRCAVRCEPLSPFQANQVSQPTLQTWQDFIAYLRRW